MWFLTDMQDEHMYKIGCFTLDESFGRPLEGLGVLTFEDFETGDYKGVVCQSMHYYMQLNNLFDIILSGELDLQDVSSMYSRIDDRITVIYSGYIHKGYRYKYEYKITDLDKFQLLLTKISIRYSKFF